MRPEILTWTVRVPGDPTPHLTRAVVNAVERALEIRFDRVVPPVQIDWDPTGIAAEWFQDRLHRGGNTPLRAASDQGPSLVWWSRRKSFNPGGVAMSECLIDAPFEARFVERAERCLGSLASELGAYVGEVSTSFEARATRGMVRGSGRHLLPPPPFGLPALKATRDLPSPLHPARPVWIQYWSVNTCRLLGFPDPSRDADLLARARRLPNGAWIVRLADEPLDPGSRHDHGSALAELCARFPAIGGRDHAGDSAKSWMPTSKIRRALVSTRMRLEASLRA